MDALDRKILHELQLEARLSVTELAERVHLSTSAAHRRLRDLERTGVLTEYRAQVDAQAVGFGFEALVFITMSDQVMTSSLRSNAPSWSSRRSSARNASSGHRTSSFGW